MSAAPGDAAEAFADPLATGLVAQPLAVRDAGGHGERRTNPEGRHSVGDESEAPTTIISFCATLESGQRHSSA
jgi:hypothetical protein